MFKFIKENKKWIFIVIITIVLFFVISILINSCSHLVVDSMIQETEPETSLQKLSMYKEYEAMNILKGIAKKNGDWKNYPLSKNFLAKYNSKDGIFQQYSFEEISCNTMVREKYSENVKVGSFYYYLYNYIDRQRHVVGPAWEVYINYRINNNNELDSIEIISDKQTVDEQGNSIIEYDKELNVNNFKNIIWDILFYDGNLKYPYGEDLLDDRAPIEITKQPCSKKFCDKVLNKDKNIDRVYIDFFPQYNCGGGAIYFLNGVSRDEAFNNREFYVTCRTYFEGARPYDGDKPEHNYLYKLNFEIDENNKLDDISLEYLYEISNEELLDKFHF